MQKNYMGAGIIFDLYLLYQRQYLSEHTNFLISFLPLQNVYQCITKIGDYNLNLFSYTVVSCKWFLNFFKSKVQFENFHSEFHRTGGENFNLKFSANIYYFAYKREITKIENGISKSTSN